MRNSFEFSALVDDWSVDREMCQIRQTKQWNDSRIGCSVIATERGHKPYCVFLTLFAIFVQLLFHYGRVFVYFFFSFFPDFFSEFVWIPFFLGGVMAKKANDFFSFHNFLLRPSGVFFSITVSDFSCGLLFSFPLLFIHLICIFRMFYPFPVRVICANRSPRMNLNGRVRQTKNSERGFPFANICCYYYYY